MLAMHNWFISVARWIMTSSAFTKVFFSLVWIFVVMIVVGMVEQTFGYTSMTWVGTIVSAFLSGTPVFIVQRLAREPELHDPSIVERPSNNHPHHPC